MIPCERKPSDFLRRSIGGQTLRPIDPKRHSPDHKGLAIKLLNAQDPVMQQHSTSNLAVRIRSSWCRDSGARSFCRSLVHDGNQCQVSGAPGHDASGILSGMPLPALLPLDGRMLLLAAASNQSRFAAIQRDTATTSLGPKDEGCEGSSQNALTCISTSGGSQGRALNPKP